VGNFIRFLFRILIPLKRKQKKKSIMRNQKFKYHVPKYTMNLSGSDPYEEYKDLIKELYIRKKKPWKLCASMPSMGLKKIFYYYRVYAQKYTMNLYGSDPYEKYRELKKKLKRGT